MSVKWYGEALLARVRAGAMQGVVEGIGIVEKKAVSLILDTPKTGRIYRRRGVEHQASAPGEPPANDTGDNLNRRRIDLIPDRIAARLIFSSGHAWFLQHGTARMKARPWADRALIETRAEVTEAIFSNIRAAIK